MTHDAHLGDGTLLHDGCPRCQEAAENPWYELDDGNRAALVTMALAWEGRTVGFGPNGELERQACQGVLETLNRVRALFDAPSVEYLVQLLRDRQTMGRSL